MLDADLTDSGEIVSTLGLFKVAIEEFNQKKVKGLIIDIRNNVGGLDSMVADMLASFYTEKPFMNTKVATMFFPAPGKYVLMKHEKLILLIGFIHRTRRTLLRWSHSGNY